MNETNQTAGGCPLWVKIVLVVSLVANMAIAGLYLGAMSQPNDRKRGSERQISWILRFVPEARKDEAEKLFASKRDQIRSHYRSRGKYLEEIVLAIRAEPFSPETVTAAMRAHRENSSGRRTVVEDTLVELLQGFTREERLFFADRMEEGLDRWKARRTTN